MAIANKLGKEFFRLLKKNFPPLSNQYKIFKMNHVKLSYSCMPNVANLINNNTKKLMNKQWSEPPKCNCIDKTKCPLKGKCEYECIVYKVKVYSSRPNNDYDNNVKIKKYM